MERQDIEDKARLLINNIYIQDADIRDITIRIQAFDPDLYVHCSNVGFIAAQTLLAMQLDDELVINTIKGALIHDVGKILVPKSILDKHGELTKDERYEIEQHPIYGAGICSSYNLHPIILDVVKNHHVRIGGLGYPANVLKPSFSAALIATVDAYDAMTSKRPYNRVKTSEEALHELEQLPVHPINFVAKIKRCQAI